MGPDSLVTVCWGLLPDLSRGLKKLKSGSMLPSVQAQFGQAVNLLPQVRH